MAVPEGITAIGDNVVIQVYGGGIGFGVTNATLSTAVGTVYKIGLNVTKVYGGDKVGFKKTESFFATSDDLGFAVVGQDDILIIYTTPP